MNDSLKELDIILGMVKAHNIGKLVYNGIEIDNNRADPYVQRKIEEITKPLSDEELLFDPFKGL